MLAETPNVRQVPGEPRRRWFSDEEFDLIVWYGDDDAITGFQLLYRVGCEERALTWTEEGGHDHKLVDTGDELPGEHRSPILVPDGVLDKTYLLERFLAAATDLETAVTTFVVRRIASYLGPCAE